MVDLLKLQKDVLQNKINKGFNTNDIKGDFLFMYGEVGEAYMAWLKQKDDLGEELADVMIYILGIAEMLDIDMEYELQHKILKNSKRVYKKVNGVSIRVKEADE